MLFILLFLSSLHNYADARSPANRDSIRSAARSLSAAYRHQDAAETLQELDKLGSAQASDYLEMGKAYLAARDRGKAKRAFQKAIKHGAEAEGFTGVGLVYEDMGAHGHLALINYRKALGKNPNHVEAQYHIAQIYRTFRPLDAESAYRTTILMDGSHPDAYFQLGKLLEEEGRLPEARAAFEKQIEENPAHGFASLNLGRQMYVEGQKRAAARIFGSLLEAGGEVETASYMEMALMSQDAKDFDNSQLLFEAYIERLPPDQQSPFIDIEHVATREDIVLLASVPESDRDEMRRRYWARLDPAPLSRANERLLEHYRRVAYSIGRFSEGEQPFDERGRAYIRLGPPDHVSKSQEIRGEFEPFLVNARRNFALRSGAGVQVTPGLPTFPVGPDERWEYWIYADLDGGLELTFTSRFSDGRYRFADVPTGFSSRTINELLSLHGDIVVSSRDESSRYMPDFADLPIDFYYYPASFRGSTEKTRLEVYYGLPAADIARSKQEDGDDLILFDRAIALYDSTWNEVHRVRDQMVFRAPTDQEVEAGAFIPGVMSVDLPPGDYWMSLQIRDRLSGKSQVYKQRIHLDDYAPRDDLQISDVELAFYVGQTDEESGEFVKNGLKVIPMSSRSFRRDQNAFVYFEIYNLKRDAFGQSRYNVEYTVRTHTKRSTPARILRGLGRILRVVEGEQEVKVSFEQTVEGSTDIAYVELDITESKPGGQVVSVKVTDMLTEISAEKVIRFSVEGN